MYHCTNASRIDMSGGTWIEVTMGFPPVFIEQAGALVETQPTKTSEYPLRIGDWVLLFATIHRWDDRSGYDMRVCRPPVFFPVVFIERAPEVRGQFNQNPSSIFQRIN